jgi:hypothetical protein
MPSRYERRKTERQKAARTVKPRPDGAHRVDRRGERSIYEDRAGGKVADVIDTAERPRGRSACKDLESEFG